MSVTKSIKCDNCQKEMVTYSNYPHKYCLELRNIDTNINDSGITYAVAMWPILDSNKHFCGVDCLRAYIKEYK